MSVTARKAFETLPWKKLPEPTRKLIEPLDPNGKSPLTRTEFKALDKAKQEQLLDIRDALRVTGQLPAVTRRHRVDRANQRVDSFDLHDTQQRKFTDIATAVSQENLVTPLFPTSVVKKGELNYDERLIETIKNAKKLIVLEGYEIDRQDIIDLLIAKAREGVEVVALFHPAKDDEPTKKALLDEMRAAKLPNLKVIDYALLPADQRGIEQIMHVKKVIADTPEGGLCEVSGGINFNKNSVRNYDFGWRTEGIAVLDSLQHALDHLRTSAPELELDMSLLPSAEKIRALTKQRAAALGEELVTVEVAASGTRPVDQPRDYPVKKLRERAKLGKKLIVSSIDAMNPDKVSLLKMGMHNGSPVTVVQVPMTEDETVRFEKERPKLKKMGFNVVRHDALVVDDSVAKLYVRELEQAVKDKESIDIGAFALSHPEVIDCLVRARKAGCAVRVLLDDLTIDNVLVNRKAIAILTAADVDVKAIDAKAKQALASEAGTAADMLKLHGKFLVIGKNRVLAGSANPTGSGLALNIEDGRLVRSKAVAAALTDTLFEPLWAKASEVRKVTRVDDASRASLLASVPIDTPIDKINFVVFDFETTGFVPNHGERIIQLAMQAMRFDGGDSPRIIEEMNAYISPGKDPLGRDMAIPAHITSLTGIDQAKVLANGNRQADEVLREFVKRLRKLEESGPVVLVGQNAPFDLRFLDFLLSLEEHGVEGAKGREHLTFDSVYVDTVDVSLRVFPNEERHSLDHQMERVNLQHDPSLPRHDAFSDVVLTGRSAARLIKKGGLQTLADLLGEDMLQFRDTTLLLNPSGKVRTHQLEFDAKDKLVVRTRDAKTGALSDPERVRQVEVRGLKNDLIQVSVYVGTGDKQREIKGCVNPNEIDFRNPGPVFYRLREQGVKLRKADVISTTS